ncbi:MAG TPA: 4-hydroxythreonine-4-phosphate dehydrogenase PdxA, partial [Rhizobacter sp.]|nr:4-hydroxythreonine-4-phosphate dehydrogenase PdxA [Rhizobacter sp.]
MTRDGIHPLPLLITQGDACGIGPEIIAKAFRSGGAHGAVVLGDLRVMRRALALTEQGAVSTLALALIEHPHDVWQCPPNTLALLQAKDVPSDLADAGVGQV